jgi:hypothetical protein
MPTNTQSFPAAWYPEHDNPGMLRYFDGSRWTDWRQPAVAGPHPAPITSGYASPVGPQKTARTLGVISIFINPLLILSILCVIFASVALSRQADAKRTGQPVEEFGTGTLWLGIIVTVLYAFALAWMTTRS